MDNKPIIALDVSSKAELSELLNYFPEESLNLKVGMELFYQQGPDIVRELKENGHALFLDIKLHDIPTTVNKAMKGLAHLGVDMINMHASGGKEMMRAALEGLEKGTAASSKRPLLLAVTQLTSTSEEKLHTELQIQHSLEENVLHLAQLTHESGVDGVVCSAWEARKIKEHTQDDFLCVTPGIRLKGEATHDQKRVASPDEAKKLGSSHIVVGRAITQADDPYLAYQRVMNQWNGESK